MHLDVLLGLLLNRFREGFLELNSEKTVSYYCLSTRQTVSCFDRVHTKLSQVARYRICSQNFQIFRTQALDIQLYRKLRIWKMLTTLNLARVQRILILLNDHIKSHFNLILSLILVIQLKLQRTQQIKLLNFNDFHHKLIPLINSITGEEMVLTAIIKNFIQLYHFYLSFQTTLRNLNLPASTHRTY